MFFRRLASAPPRRVVLGSVLGSRHDVWGGDGGGEGVPVKVSTYFSKRKPDEGMERMEGKGG